jgi:hypothetical protein
MVIMASSLFGQHDRFDRSDLGDDCADYVLFGLEGERDRAAQLRRLR